MKILLQINVVANSGSTGRIAEELGRLVIAKGWKSYIAYGRWSCPSQSKLIRIGTKVDLFFHGLKSILFDRHGFGSRKATLKLISKIEKIKPDIIHLHNIHGYYLNCKILFEYLSCLDIPVVWTLHDCWSFTGHCVHFQNVGCNKWLLGCFACPNKRDYPTTLFLDNSQINYVEKKLLFTTIDRMIIVPVCNWLNEMIGSSYLSQLRRYTIVNGIDLKVFRPSTDLSVLIKRYGLESKFVVLAVASNWNVTKGEFDIYHWARQVSDDVRFVMIGLTKTQIRKLPINILGFERTEDINQLVDFYSLADVFINPTYQDTFPTVNIEAMACGTPVITYNTGGCKEMITDSIGFVIDRGDKVKFLESLNEVRMKPKGYYKECCRNRAIQLYNKDERYAEYLKLYYKILNYSL